MKKLTFVLVIVCFLLAIGCEIKNPDPKLVRTLTKEEENIAWRRELFDGHVYVIRHGSIAHDPDCSCQKTK
jgi:hypothetical protein